MNPDPPKNPREEMEAWLTSLLLGELSAGEAAAVRELMKHDAELAGLHDRLRQSIALLREAVPHVEPPSPSVEPQRLSEERRKKLLAAFAIPPLKPATARPRRQVRFRLIEVLAGLTIVALLAAVFLPALSRTRSSAQLGNAITPFSRAESSRRAAETSLGHRQWSLDGGRPMAANPTPAAPPDSSGIRTDDVVGYVNVAIPATNYVAAVTFGASRVDANQTGQTPNPDRGKEAVSEPRPAIAPPVQIVLPQAQAADGTFSVAEPESARFNYYGRTMSAGTEKQTPESSGLARGSDDIPVRFAAPSSFTPDALGSLRGSNDRSPAAAMPSIGLATEHVFAEGRPSETLRDSFVVGTEPETLMRSAAQNKPNVVTPLPTPPAQGFYRLAGGQGGGGGAGGEVAGRPSAAAPTTPPEKIPVLGDIPALGKVFAQQDSLNRADTALGFEVVGTATGLTQPPSSKPVEEASLGRGLSAGGVVAAEPVVRGVVVAGDAVAQDQTGRLPRVFTAGGYSAVAPSAVTTPTSATAEAPVQAAEVAQQRAFQERYGIAVEADVKKGVAARPTDPARRLNESLTSGLRGAAGERGRQLIEEGRLLLEAGKPAEAQAKLKSAAAADPGSQAGQYYLSFANEAKSRAAKRASERTTKDKLVNFEHDWASPRNPLANVPIPQRSSRVGDVERNEAGAKFEQQIAQKRGELEKLRRELEVSDLDAAGTASKPTLEAESLRKYKASLGEAQVKLAELASVASMGEALSPEQQKQVAGAKAVVEKLEDGIAVAEAEDLKKVQNSRAYYDKKRELEQLHEQLRISDSKLAAEKIDLSIPRTSMVEIVDRAQPATEKSGGLRGLGVPIGGSYASTARVKVERDVTDIEGVAGARSALGYDPYFVQTEFEAMQSEAVLGKVVERLKLNQTWAERGADQALKTTDAISLLKSKLSLKPVKDTGLVEIRVTDADAKEAADIANAVAETYAEQRAQSKLSLSQGGGKALDNRLQEQSVKIAQAQKELEVLRQQLAVSDSDAGGLVPALPVVAEHDYPAPRKAATNAPIPQPEIQTSENNFSTFSLNVSDVSFKLAMASLEKGQMPDAASIRSEEFINAFDYRDPEPAAGVPIAFAWERARYPFAHNRDLLRFSLKTAAEGRINGRPLNLVLLLDNSGSMERADRVSILREALRVLAAQLQPQDKLSVITFARTPRLVADGIPGDKAGEVAEQVSGLTPQGGTNLEEAMNLAYQTALKHYLAGGINRVVLLTDGAANLGNVEPESLKQQVETQRKQGIALDCFGIGWEGFNDDLLETLSRNGDGRYGFINSPEEAASEFAGQLAGALKVAASDVKVQVEFNPKRVTSYRQIGYAKHQLTKEQFRDNTVDAAEIAAQEAGNALYTVEVNPAGDGPLCTVRCRFKISGTTDYREQAWDVPFTGNALLLEQASPAMRLAGSAAAFAEWLVASPFAPEVTPDRVLGVMSGVPEVFGADSRPKKLEWMIRQAKSLEGK